MPFPIKLANNMYILILFLPTSLYTHTQTHTHRQRYILADHYPCNNDADKSLDCREESQALSYLPLMC